MTDPAIKQIRDMIRDRMFIKIPIDIAEVLFYLLAEIEQLKKEITQ